MHTKVAQGHRALQGEPCPKSKRVASARAFFLIGCFLSIQIQACFVDGMLPFFFLLFNSKVFRSIGASLWLTSRSSAKYLDPKGMRLVKMATAVPSFLLDFSEDKKPSIVFLLPKSALRDDEPCCGVFDSIAAKRAQFVEPK